MQPDIQQYYDDLLDLFTTPGWKSFIEEMEAEIERIDTIRGLTTEELHYNQGALSVLERFQNFENTARQSLEEIENEEAA